MHLYQLRLVNYRRFVDATINLDSRMVAILGPNESGKSSLLDALALFNEENRVPAVHLRRGSDSSDARLVGELTYGLTNEERAAIPYDLPASVALWLRVRKRVGGAIDFALHPPPQRPRAARIGAAAAMKKALESAWYRKLKADEDVEADDPLTGILEMLASELDVQDEQLPKGALNDVQRAISRLSELDLTAHSATGRKAIKALITKLKSGAEIEGLATPLELAATIAVARPRAIPFDDAHRTLGFTHNLGNLAALSAAFENLTDFGGLKLPALQAAIQAGDSGAKRTLLGNAVTQINRRLEEEWGQSDLLAPLAASRTANVERSALSTTASAW